MRFVRNQLTGFMFDRMAEEKTYLIHDNSGELRWFDYESLGIIGVATVPYSPNMNSYAERFVRSLRNECLDWFIIWGRSHLGNLVSRYVKYYNTMRPHQGIGNTVPDGKPVEETGEVKSRPVVFGRFHHFYREAA